jgi:hypothetical protein
VRWYPELAVGLCRTDDHMLLAAVAAMRVAFCLVISRRHHVDEGRDIGVMDQRQIIPLIAAGLAERDCLGISRPQQRAAARLDHRHGQRAVAQVSIPARSVAVERARPKTHQIDHHDGSPMLELFQSLDVEQIDAHGPLLPPDRGIVALRVQSWDRMRHQHDGPWRPALPASPSRPDQLVCRPITGQETPWGDAEIWSQF